MQRRSCFDSNGIVSWGMYDGNSTNRPFLGLIDSAFCSFFSCLLEKYKDPGFLLPSCFMSVGIDTYNTPLAIASGWLCLTWYPPDARLTAHPLILKIEFEEGLIESGRFIAYSISSVLSCSFRVASSLLLVSIISCVCLPPLVGLPGRFSIRLSFDKT